MPDISKFTSGDKPKDIENSTWLRMMAARRWLVWKSVTSGAPGIKPKKMPCYPDTFEYREGKLDTAEDLARLGSYELVSHICKGSDTFKPGFVLGPDGMRDTEGHQLGWQGLDVDGVVMSKIEAEKLGGGYVEESPSGNGSHWLTYGRLFKNKVVKHETYNEEWYSYARFLTVTEKKIYDGPIVDMFDKAGTGHVDRDEVDLPPQPMSRLTEKELKDLKDALRHLDPDVYDNWYRTLMILRQVEGGKAIAQEWSRRSDKHKQSEFNRKFETVGEPVGHWRTIFSWAKDAGWDPVLAAVRGSFKGEFEFIEYDLDVPKAIEYVLDGFVMTGSTVISGSAGVGKTSIIGPWAAIICHLTQKNLLTPIIRRPVFYFSEDTDQLVRILRGMKKMGMLTADQEEIKHWLKIIPATRRSTEDFVHHLKMLKEKYDADPVFYNGYKVEPLFILDTAVSNLAIKDIKDNSEISGVVNDIRVAVGKASIWFVTHIPKALKNAEPEAMSAIGAAAWGGDTQAEMIIFKNDAPDHKFEEDERRVMLGKHRFDSAFTELVCHTQVVEEVVTADWGEEQPIRYRAAVVFTQSSREDRKGAAEEAKERQKEDNNFYNVMESVKAFRHDLEASGGIFFSRSKNPRIVIPEGCVRRNIFKFHYKGRSNIDTKKIFWENLVELFKPEETPSGDWVFRRQEIQDL